MYYKITNGAIEIDGNPILEEINIEIKDKEHIAIIGRNGSGKTTLLKALIDNDYLSKGVSEDDFNIIKNGNFKIGYLRQNLFTNDNITLLEEILKLYEPLRKMEQKIIDLEKKLELGSNTKTILEYENIREKYKLNGGYTYKKEYLMALKKFGFLGQENKLLSDFSGGEKTKLALLILLLSKPDLLILDEPTNNLDIKAIEWLEEYLVNYPFTFIVVSHDREFIDKTTNKIYEIEYGATTLYHGNYTKYLEIKQSNYERALKNYDLVLKEKMRLQAIADRFRYKPTKAKMALSKLKQIERLPKLSKPRESNTKTFNIKNMDFKSSSRIVLTTNDLKIGYNNTLNEVTLTLEAGEKLAIVGSNGVGKSTFLETLMGNIASLGGKYEFGNNVIIGYFNQQLNTLNLNNTVYEEIRSNSSLNDFEIRVLLASFMFEAEEVNKKISVLSGGEKVLLELSKIILKKPNLLILDEPTNHLDILGREKLGLLLKDYGGTIMVVSHDRYLLREIATSVLEFKKEGVHFYKLNYDEYLEKTKVLEDSNNIEKKIKPINKTKKSLNNNIGKLEKVIGKKEEELKKLKNKIYDSDTYNNYELLNKTNNDIERLEKEIQELMSLWEEEMQNYA